MIWVWLFLAAAVATPLVAEGLRQKMDASARKAAPGHFAPLPQGITHFRWYGPEDGPVIVCVHGLTTPSFVWERLAGGLAARGYRVLTYDLFGRGYSDRVTGLQDRKFFLRQLNDLLEALEVQDEIILIGYSMGGTISTAFAADAPKRVRHLILLASAGMGHVGGSWLRKATKTPMLGTWLMLALYPSVLRRGLAEGAKRSDAVPEIIDLQAKELRWRGFVPAVLSSHRGILSDNFRPDHETMALGSLPVTAIWGSTDDVIPLTAKDQLAAWNPKVDHLVIEGAGHEVTYTHGEAVLKQILARLG
ncbi:MAG: alpha/beta fold hydrolase [Roseobacter sp.]